jgi:hypothetical protein
MPIRRYIVPRGSNQIAQAFQAIADICNSAAITSVTLVVPKKGRWDRSIVAEFLGEQVAKALLNGRPVEVTSGVALTLDSAQTFRVNADHGLLIGAHISIKDMNKLDDSLLAQAIMFLPWNDTEDQEWRATWQPEIIGSSSCSAPSSALSTAVEDALRRLTQHINLGTGLGHPSDAKFAKTTLAKLKAEGHTFDPAEVRRWAQRNGWGSSAAADLEKIARKNR